MQNEIRRAVSEWLWRPGAARTRPPSRAPTAAPWPEEGGPSLVDCTAAVWWLDGGWMAVLKVTAAAGASPSGSTTCRKN